jgi:GTPase KRas protein
MDDSHRVTITVCGDGGCGKSSITLRLVRSQWTHEYVVRAQDSGYSTQRIRDADVNFAGTTLQSRTLTR